MATKVQSSNAGKTKIAQLKKQTVVDIEPNKFKIEAWLTTARRLTDQAEVAQRNGDLEQAYISYTKALTIALEKVPKHKDFKQAEKDRNEAYEQYTSFRLGIEKIFNEAEAVASTIEGLENISQSSATASPSIALALAPATAPAPAPVPAPVQAPASATTIASSPSPVSDKKQTSSEQSPIKMPEPPAHVRPGPASSSQPYLTVRTDNMPIASAGRLPSPVHIYALNTIGSIGPSSTTSHGGASLQLPSPIFYRQQGGNMTPPLRSPGSSLPANYVAMPSPKSGTIFPIKNTISATELEEVLFKTFERPRVLIVDIRVHSQFQMGHIKTTDIVCIEPIILKDEISSLDIEHRLILSPEHERRMFAERNVYDMVVYHDQDSAQAPDPTLNTQPAALLGREYPNALKNFVLALHTNEFHKPLRRPPMLLVGGFNAWKRLVGDRGIVKEQVGLMTPSRPLSSPHDKAKRNAMFVDDVVGALVSSPTVIKTNLQRHGAIGRGYAKDYLDFFRNRNGIAKQSMTGSDFGLYNQQMPTPLAPVNAGPPPVYPMEMPSPAPLPPVSSELQQPAKVQALQRRRTMTMMFDHPFYGFTHVDDPLHVTPPRPTRPLPTPPARSTASTIITKTGLPNLTNTCYMNAVVQVLRCTRPFAMYFVDGIYKKDRRAADTDNRKKKFLKFGSSEETKDLEIAFAELITALRGINATDAMVSFRSSVSANARAQGEEAWASNDQQDAQEFLGWLLWTLGDRVKKPPDEQKLAELNEMEKQRPGLSEEEISDLEWGKFYQNNRSIFVGIVGFIQRRRLECLNCRFKSSNFDPLLHMTVPIPAKTNNSMMHRVSLHDCLDAEFVTEVLTGIDAWKCEKCDPAAAGKARESTLSKALLSLPNILIVHLNRFFCIDPLLQQYGKLNNFVEFPLEGLDMSKYADTVNMKSHASTTYNLYAVVNHLGATKSMGHYTASIYDRGLDKWYRYDDRNVREISSAEVTSSGNTAYMLFYVRDRVDFFIST